jgi:hypothetical protein
LSGWTSRTQGKDERDISLEMIRLRTGSEQKGGKRMLETFTQKNKGELISHGKLVGG